MAAKKHPKWEKKKKSLKKERCWKELCTVRQIWKGKTRGHTHCASLSEVGFWCSVTKGEEVSSPSSHGGRGGSVLVRKGHVTLLRGLKVAVNSSQVLFAFGQTMGTPEWEATVPPLPAE